MGVYQSVTEPSVRRVAASEVFRAGPGPHLTEEYLTQYMREKYRIPAKVRPEVTYSSDRETVEIAYRWFRVETFN